VIQQEGVLIICDMEVKIPQPDKRSLRLGFPTASYAVLAAISNESSTQHMDSSLEIGICKRRASIMAWSTIIRQSWAGGAGTVNPYLGVAPDMLDFSF
jgi:hypothetical protein